MVAIEAIGEKIVLTRHPSSDSTADDEYTPAQRRAIVARSKAAEKGPFFGPFKSGEEVAAFLKKQSKLRPARSAKGR